MNYWRTVGLLLLPLPVLAAPAPQAPVKRAPKEALRAFNDLIGSWRASGTPYGTREERDRGFWQEKIAWQWHFKGKDVSLQATFDKGRHFTSAELRYLPDRDRYELKAVTPKKETLTFEGALAGKRLTLDRTDPGSKETQRLVVSLLHSNRYLYRYEVRPAEHTVFTQVYQVGATKEGVAFAGDDDKPECVVSGGLGTMTVSYKGKTYYVCCSGCRDAFKDEPEKYIKEFEARKKTKK